MFTVYCSLLTGYCLLFTGDCKWVTYLILIPNHLAQLHFEADRGIEQVLWMVPANGFEKEVRLLEVNRTTIPSGSVLVFPFAPSDDIPFQQLIADVTPREWKQIESGKLPLPHGWNLKTAQVFQRSPQVLRGK